MKFKRFTKPGFLKGIGRTLLDKLFGKYAGAGVKMPEQGADDAADSLRYLVATKSRTVTLRKLRGL
jgi:hypothetical protein